jgi:hypothetical protein
MYQQPEPNRFNQNTDRGVNNVSITEHNHQLNAPHLPLLLSLSTWARWPMRWAGFFALGTTLPSLYVIAPPIIGFTITVTLLIGLLMMIGWSAWHRHHFIPAGVALGLTLLGFAFSLITLIHGSIDDKSRTTPSTIPASIIDT